MTLFFSAEFLLSRSPSPNFALLPASAKVSAKGFCAAVGVRFKLSRLTMDFNASPTIEVLVSFRLCAVGFSLLTNGA